MDIMQYFFSTYRKYHNESTSCFKIAKDGNNAIETVFLSYMLSLLMMLTIFFNISMCSMSLKMVVVAVVVVASIIVVVVDDDDVAVAVAVAVVVAVVVVVVVVAAAAAAAAAFSVAALLLVMSAVMIKT